MENNELQNQLEKLINNLESCKTHMYSISKNYELEDNFCLNVAEVSIKKAIEMIYLYSLDCKVNNNEK